MDNAPNPSATIPVVTFFFGRKLDSLKLPELLELRDTIISYQADIKRDHPKGTYSLVLGKIQSWIYYRRTHRNSGLIIPYSKDITSE